MKISTTNVRFYTNSATVSKILSVVNWIIAFIVSYGFLDDGFMYALLTAWIFSSPFIWLSHWLENKATEAIETNKGQLVEFPCSVCERAEFLYECEANNCMDRTICWHCQSGYEPGVGVWSDEKRSRVFEFYADRQYGNPVLFEYADGKFLHPIFGTDMRREIRQHIIDHCNYGFNLRPYGERRTTIGKWKTLGTFTFPADLESAIINSE